MSKTISKVNLNMLIVPLTDPQSESLEDYLGKMVVSDKSEEEFICVVGASYFGSFSVVSYGKYDQVEFSQQESAELEKKIVFYGRKWLSENTDLFLDVH